MSAEKEVRKGSKPKKSYSLKTKTGQMAAKQKAKRSLSSTKAKGKVALRKATGNTGKPKVNAKNVIRGGKPKRPTKVQQFIKRLRKGPSKSK